MPLARIGHKMLFFAHIPKTGGTSVESYLRQKGQVAFHHSKAHDWTACSPQHYHAALYDVLFPAAFYDHGFAVIREPMSRLQSEYRYRDVQTQKQGRGPLPPFDQWVARVFRRHGRNPFVLDNHLRPQIEFLTEGIKVFRLEDGLDRVYDWIDAVSDDGRVADRSWKKKTERAPIKISAETRAMIEDFYEADIDLFHSLAPAAK